MGSLLVILYIWNFVRTFLIIIVIYYAVKIIGKLFFSSAINQAKSNARQAQQNRRVREEGEVTIIKDKNKSSKNDRNEGEYVDFEEVD